MCFLHSRNVTESRWQTLFHLVFYLFCFLLLSKPLLPSICSLCSRLAHWQLPVLIASQKSCSQRILAEMTTTVNIRQHVMWQQHAEWACLDAFASAVCALALTQVCNNCETQDTASKRKHFTQSTAISNRLNGFLHDWFGLSMTSNKYHEFHFEMSIWMKCE